MEKKYIRYIEWMVPGYDQTKYPPAINGKTKYYTVYEGESDYQRILIENLKADPFFKPKTREI